MRRIGSLISLGMLVWLAGTRTADASGILKITPAQTRVTVAPGEPLPSGTYQVKNTSARTVNVTVNDNAAWFTLTPTSFTLGAGATQTVTYSATALAAGGPYVASIYFTVQSAGGTNAPVAKILVRFIYKVASSQTDLQVSGVVLSPSTTVACGKPFQVKATLKNAGAKPSGPFRVRWKLNGSKFYEGTHPSLAGGAVSNDYTTVLNFKKGKPAGTYTFKFFADPNDAVLESNSGNNSAYKTLTVSCP